MLHAARHAATLEDPLTSTYCQDPGSDTQEGGGPDSRYPSKILPFTVRTPAGDRAECYREGIPHSHGMGVGEGGVLSPPFNTPLLELQVISGYYALTYAFFVSVPRDEIRKGRVARPEEHHVRCPSIGGPQPE